MKDKEEANTGTVISIFLWQAKLSMNIQLKYTYKDTISDSILPEKKLWLNFCTVQYNFLN